VVIVERIPRIDDRGRLERLFDMDDLATLIPTVGQVNRVLTAEPGTVRGLHLQVAPHGEVKLVTCVRGRAFDVAVDLRAGSPTFLRWLPIELDESTNVSVLLPIGVAHGVQSLTPDVELIYVHSQPYRSADERGIIPTDPRIGVDWPLEVRGVSERDRSLPTVSDSFSGFPG
jgi:dTDP-4-dehydrorhamnose 3,5-epimerase